MPLSGQEDVQSIGQMAETRVWRHRPHTIWMQ